VRIAWALAVSVTAASMWGRRVGVIFVPPSAARAGVDRPLEERMTCAAYACMAYWFYRWDWGEAAAFDGIEDAVGALDWEPGAAFLHTELARELDAHRAGHAAARFAPCRVLLHLRDELDVREAESYVRTVAAAIAGAARSPRGAFLLEEGSGSGAVFIDSIYGDPALLAEAGSTFGDDDLVEAASRFALGLLEELQDTTSGLVSHFAETHTGVRPGIPWGRGNGWAVLGLSDLLVALPREADASLELLARYRLLVDGVLAHQSPSGAWRNVISDPASYPESSTTAMVVAGITQSVAAGHLDEVYRVAAERGWEAIAHRIDPSGHLVGVSYRPGLNVQPSRYEHAPVGGVYPWGNGPYLRAAAQRVR